MSFPCDKRIRGSPNAVAGACLCSPKVCESAPLAALAVAAGEPAIRTPRRIDFAGRPGAPPRSRRDAAPGRAFHRPSGRCGTGPVSRQAAPASQAAEGDRESRGGTGKRQAITQAAVLPSGGARLLCYIIRVIVVAPDARWLRQQEGVPTP